MIASCSAGGAIAATVRVARSTASLASGQERLQERLDGRRIDPGQMVDLELPGGSHGKHRAELGQGCLDRFLLPRRGPGRQLPGLRVERQLVRWAQSA